MTRPESPEDIAPMLSDPRLADYVAMWPRVPLLPDGSPDHELAAVMMRASPSDAKTMHQRAMLLGLIKLGGEVHASADAFNRARVLSEISKMRGKMPSPKSVPNPGMIVPKSGTTLT